MANPMSVAQDLIFHAPDQFRCALDSQLMMDPVRTPQAWLQGSCMTRTVPEAPGLQYGQINDYKCIAGVGGMKETPQATAGTSLLWKDGIQSWTAPVLFCATLLEHTHTDTHR